MEEPTYTVVDLSAAISRSLTRAFPDEVWVRGEIRNIRRTSNVYFTLVDADDDGASLPVVLFPQDREVVNRVLTRSGALRMTDGVEVRIRGRVTHYPARGEVQLRMTFIDPDYTVGRLAAARRRLLQTLAAEGLLESNGSLVLSPVPLRVGLVTSLGSAAHADFLQELRDSRLAFRVREIDARVQGTEAPSSIVAALRAAARDADVVAVVRGGGAASDLAAFDDERVARAIAACPVPVFTGIGHEVDQSIADEVAAASFKTPTACAAALVSAVSRYLAELERAGMSMVTTAGSALSRSGSELSNALRRLAVAGHSATARAGNALERHSHRIPSMAAAVLGAQTAETLFATRSLRAVAARAVRQTSLAVEAMSATVAAYDPARLLERGWSVTRIAGGRVITSAGELEVGDIMETRLSRGSVTSVVRDVRPRDGEET